MCMPISPEKCLELPCMQWPRQLFSLSTHVKTHKLLQTCKQVVTSLFTSCSQDVFALLVPNLLEQVWNKLLTNCNMLDGTSDLLQDCSNKTDTA